MYDALLRTKLLNGASLVGFAHDLALLVVAEIHVPRARVGQEGTSSTSQYTIVERLHYSDHAQVARQLGQDSFLYQEGNQDQKRKGERDEKKRLIG